MTERPEAELTPEERRARDAVRSLPVPRADPAFRARLREEFVSGRVAAPPPARSPVRPAVGGFSIPWGLAAAAVMLFVFGYFLNRGPSWQVVGMDGAGSFVVDGRTVPADRVALARSIRPGSRVRVAAGAGGLELLCPGRFYLQLTPGTEMVIPRSPGRWFGRRVAARITSGHARVITGPDFAGAHLDITSPFAAVEVIGTTIGIICTPEGTCVCVFHGTARVGRLDGGAVAVPEGKRRFVWAGDRAPEIFDIDPAEAVELGRFQDQGRRLLNDN